MKRKLVFLEWLDHCSSGKQGWKDADEVMDLAPMVMTSVGWILKETPKWIILTAHLHGEKEHERYVTHCQGDLCVMKCAVTKRVAIKQTWSR